MIKPKVGAKEFFLYLGAIVGLYWSAISFIQLVTEIINYRFPDALAGYYNYGYTDTMRYAIASLIIVFPIYLLLSWLNQREIALEPSMREIWIRKWLLLLTLFVAGITVVVDLVVFLNTFLGGEITTRFVLKALTVFVVAIVVFGYYIWEIRTSETVSSKRKIYAGTAVGVVILSLIFGFLTVGSPNTQRLLRFDERRVNDLQNIQYQIINYWQLKEKLPTSLNDLTDSISGFKAPVDPETGSMYVYEVSSQLEFRLCADFKLPAPSSDRSVMSKTEVLPVGMVIDQWEHGSGRVCFTRTIDPSLYPPYKTTTVAPMR